MRTAVENREKRAAIYIRVSTHYQIDKDSLPFQRNELENYSKYALNIENYVVFEDPGYSGKNTERPAYQDMMRRVRVGEFTHILVWKIDRISRNLRDFTDMYEEIKKYKVSFVSKNEQFDTGNAMGEAMLKIILVFAELERKLTAERVYAIMLNRAGKGLWNGANVPLGYRWSEETRFPVPDESDAKIVKMIYDLYESTESTSLVFMQLHNGGFKTKRGGAWTTKAVVDIIRNPFYKGTYRYNYRESARGKKKDKSEWIIIDDNHEPIISTVQWERCNEIMDKNAQKHSTEATVKKHTHVLVSLIKCARCGRNYHGSADRPRDSGYRPSAYRCPTATLHIGCDNQYVSDIRMLPFILTFIVNLIRQQDNPTSHNNESLEKGLLSGDVFSGVVGIQEDDLGIALRLLDGNHGYQYDFVPPVDVSVEVERSVSDLKMDRLQEETVKNSRALERLRNLYLYSEGSMSEKEFLVDKKKIESDIAEVRKRIKQLSKENNSQSKGTENNAASFEEASQFVFNNLFSEGHLVDIDKALLIIDKSLLKLFLKTVIDRIVVDFGKVQEIVFSNNLRFRFVYKD